MKKNNVQWDLFDTPIEKRFVSMFALGFINRDVMLNHNISRESGLSRYIRNHGVNSARRVARKALKRREILTNSNTVNLNLLNK